MNEAHCSRYPGHRLTRACGQGTRARLCVRQVVAAALRQKRAHGRWGGSGCAGDRRWLVWLRAEATTACLAPGGGSDGSCRRWRHEQRRRKQVRQWLRALAMARVGSAVAQVAGERKDMK